ncbi:multifunctional beta-oxidation protein [Armillaria borealis]|uniref:Multifunctional beta-oxidation protein n=1 Tax=Armillaria borealis TaxID=47425 RepID=A0AA39JWC3_9AGAR|nr:multifunctional beta-oxidation protein [Armillaria borealis]
MPLTFKGHTVIITGAGGGLGKAYSLFFASRGANIVVNDFNAAAAQKVVDEIVKAGGKAVANTSSVTDGAAVIKTAVDAFGGVTILINNAGILRDKAFKNMTDKEWDQIMEVHLKGAFACTKAAWPIFRKQKFGRVVNTASAAGIYGDMGGNLAHLVIGNFGQANYSAAKMGLIGFTKTLAREGAKYGIKAIAIAPMAASSMTETIMPPEMLAKLGPEFVPPFVAAVCHPEGPDASGRVFELGAGFIAEVRWERSDGAVFKTDASFTPSAIKARWDEIVDFSKPYYPTSVPDVDAEGKLALAAKLPPNPQSKPEVRFDGQTVIITGAGAGLGRIYALMYGKLGANVVVNDVSEKGANSVVEEVIKAGGKAVAAVHSAEDGDAIVKVALEKFGGVHVLVANAGVLRDKSFQAMTEQEWDLVLAVHLQCAKAVWPIFQKQTYGRIVTTCSQVGIYGNFGQANYSTAKAGIMSLTKTLAFEGRKYNILANVIAPSAGTAMTATVWPQEMVDAFKPDFIAPLVGYLTSKDNEETSGSLFEVLGGWAAQTRWQRSGGYGFPSNTPYTPEDVVAKWKDITAFGTARATYPTTTADAMQKVWLSSWYMYMISDVAFRSSRTSTIMVPLKQNYPNPFADPEDADIVVEAKKMIVEPTEYSYTERDVILYNLGVGATEKELKWTFEGDEDFSAIPTFGVIPQFLASSGFPSDWLPDYNPAKLLHGEQFLSIKAPIPTSGELVTRVRLLEALDKGKAAAVTTINETRDKHTGALIFENQSTVFIRGSGGFGGKRVGKDRGAATAANAIPKRAPDVVLEEKTVPTQAALYRLSGDTNPLHILPEFAAMGGFDKPILHGLCSMGISGKHVFKTFGPFKDIKVRFAGVVYPGETLVTLMWKEGPKVVFLTKVKERDSVVLASAGVTLVDNSERAKL